MNRRTFLAATGVIGMWSGAVIGTGALTSVSGDRGFTVGTVDDHNAVLALDGVSDAGTTPRFTNNASQTMVVTLDSSGSSVEFDVGDDRSFTDPPVEFEIPTSDYVDVAINGSSESVPVQVDAELQDSNRITTATVSLTRNYAVPRAGQISLTPNVTATGTVENTSSS